MLRKSRGATVLDKARNDTQIAMQFRRTWQASRQLPVPKIAGRSP